MVGSSMPREWQRTAGQVSDVGVPGALWGALLAVVAAPPLVVGSLLVSGLSDSEPDLLSVFLFLGLLTLVHATRSVGTQLRAATGGVEPPGRQDR